MSTISRAVVMLSGEVAAARARLMSASTTSRFILLKQSVELLQTLVFVLFLFRWTNKTWYQLRGRGLLGTTKELYLYLRLRAYGVFLSIPAVRKKIKKDVLKATDDMEHQLAGLGEGVTRYAQLPIEGWTADQVKGEMSRLNEMEHDRWEDGRVSGAVYFGEADLVDVQTDAIKTFMTANPIHPAVWPGVRKMEAEIVAMVLNMFNAPEGAAGVTTSGGTESILMAVLSARQKAYKERGVRHPEMIVPDTAHAAFLKAGEYFKIRIHLVACPAPTYKVDIAAVRRLINPNTILLVGSAPNFPHGIIDDISALSTLATRHSLPLHVDCCLGSFMIAMLSRAGFACEPFDFRLPGVTSISCDTHKYGGAPKGNSTVLYRTRALRSYQYFISADWSGGVYASPSIAGSRPGALIAGCWATMMHCGESGYITACRSIITAAKRLESCIRHDPELRADLTVIGDPQVTVVAFTSKTLNIYDVADAMSKRGWHLNSLQNPPGMHVAVTLPIVKAVEELVADLKMVVAEEKEKERERVASGLGRKGMAEGTNSALYGVAGSFPDKRIVRDLAGAFLDTLYKV